MFSTVSILVLACAIITVNAQEPQCTPAQIGVVPTGHPVKLPPVALQPLMADWVITVPPVPECVYGVAGVHAFACDIDAAPTAFFTDSNHLRVHRNGNLQYANSVVVTVYCN